MPTVNKEQKLKQDEYAHIPALIEQLGSREGLKRQQARLALADIGAPAVDFLAELIEHPKHVYRWECVKALVQIADPDALELFLLALEDEDFDVRWLAAEGLIKLGQKSVIPVVEYLMANVKKEVVRNGAHHVLKALRRRSKAKEELDELISALWHKESAGNISNRAFDFLNRIQELSAT
ncbi:HEAT repeat domain-containing protein [bacterium]|nr:HEAT repeat domain-containing protein [bacterium]